jgi:hypothetical protein
MSIRSLIVAIVVTLAGLVLASPAQAYPTMPPGVQGPFTVTKVVDGDTIWVDNNGQKPDAPGTGALLRPWHDPCRHLQPVRGTGAAAHPLFGAVRFTPILSTRGVSKYIFTAISYVVCSWMNIGVTAS